MTVDLERVEDITRALLVALGQDVNRDGLQATPHRVARWWQEFIDYDPGNTDTVFESVHVDQMVVVNNVRVWSLCEHHLLPFWCDLSMGYLTSGKVLGLSKFARVAHACSHKLQLQERLVNDIADELVRLTSTENVAVIAQGEHLCMTMRGVRTEGHMVTSAMRGAFRENVETRTEFLRLANGKSYD